MSDDTAPDQPTSPSKSNKSDDKVANGATSAAHPPSAESEGAGGFKLESLQAHFEACLGENGTLYVDKYILGYEELYKFLNLLGTVFGWVAIDVYNKMAILKEHKSGESADKYESIQGMLAYEVEAKLIKPKARDTSTGTRNLLRLHRALEYINAFLEAVQTLEVADKCCHVSQEAYKKTLIRFHPWVVQKAALLAMHMLPTKEGLIQKICKDGTDEEETKKAAETLKKAVAAMQAVYDRTQEEYNKHDLLALP